MSCAAAAKSGRVRHGVMRGLIVVAMAWSMAAAAAAQAPQRVEVPSLDAPNGVVVVQPGFWFVSASAGNPAPAIVLLHGCGGPYASGGGKKLSQRMRDYAALFNRLGVHALVTDSLSPRGETELCTQRLGARAVTQVQRRRDALAALHWLAAQAGVDRQRLGLIGWSHGGSAVLAASNAQHREVLAAAVQPSLAVAFYPGCTAHLSAGFRAAAPLLLLLGDADDWTPAAPCKSLAAAALALGGAPIEVEAYPGAYHGFDGNAPLRLRRDVPNGVNPGQGVHVGGNRAAALASHERLKAFVQTVWRLP